MSGGPEIVEHDVAAVAHGAEAALAKARNLMGSELMQELAELRAGLRAIRSGGRLQFRHGLGICQPVPQLVDLQMKATDIGHAVSKILYHPVGHDR